MEKENVMKRKSNPIGKWDYKPIKYISIEYPVHVLYHKSICWCNPDVNVHINYFNIIIKCTSIVPTTFIQCVINHNVYCIVHSCNQDLCMYMRIEKELVARIIHSWQ